MTFNQIRYFLEVAEHLSFSTAAQNLYMTQPALGRQITALEQELNIQLFLRTTRSVKLTPAGQYLYKQWAEQMKSFDESVQQAKKINEGYSGELLIGILEGVDLGLFFADILLKFEQKYPNIKIHMKQYSFGELRKKLKNKELDGVLTYYFDVRDVENVEYKNLYKFQPCWAVPIANPLTQKDSISVADLKNEEFVITSVDDSPFGHQLLLSLCKDLGGFSPKVHCVDSLEEVILKVETSNKCTLMNQQLRIAKSSKIKTFPFEDQHDVAYYVFAWLKNNNNMSLRLFQNIIETMKKSL